MTLLNPVLSVHHIVEELQRHKAGPAAALKLSVASALDGTG
jgi:hypothetical protein